MVTKLSYGRICLIEGHVFLEYMSFKMTCITGTFISREVMLYRRTCIMRGHVLQVCMYSGCHIFQDDVFTGMHVLQENRSYLKYVL